MSTNIDNSRREFLRMTSLTAGGFLLGFNWLGNELKAAPVAINAALAGDVGFNS